MAGAGQLKLGLLHSMLPSIDYDQLQRRLARYQGQRVQQEKLLDAFLDQVLLSDGEALLNGLQGIMRLVTEHDWDIDQLVRNVLTARWEQWIGRINVARFEATVALMTWLDGKHIVQMVGARSMTLMRDFQGDRAKGLLMSKALILSHWTPVDLAFDLSICMIRLGRMPIDQVTSILTAGLTFNQLEGIVQRLLNKFMDSGDVEVMEMTASMIGALAIWHEPSLKVLIKHAAHREGGVRRAAMRAVSALLVAHPKAFSPLAEPWSRQLSELYRKDKDPVVILNALHVLLLQRELSASAASDFIPLWLQQLKEGNHREPILACLTALAANHPSLLKAHVHPLLTRMTMGDGPEVGLLREMRSIDGDAQRWITGWTLVRLKQLLMTPSAEQIRFAADLVKLANGQTWPLIQPLQGTLTTILLDSVSGPFHLDHFSQLLELIALLVEPLGLSHKQTLFPFLDELVELLFRLNRLEIGPQACGFILDFLARLKFPEVLASMRNFLSILMLACTAAESGLSGEAAALVGRLGRNSSGIALPLMRKQFLQIIAEIRNAESDLRGAMRIIRLLIKSHPVFVDVYAKPILNSIWFTFDSHDHEVLIILFDIIDEVAQRHPKELTPILRDAIDRSLSCLLESNSGSIALKLRATSLLVNLLKVFPRQLLQSSDINSFLDQLLSLMRREESVEVRVDLLRLLGTIGALDPEVKRALSNNDGLIESTLNDNENGLTATVDECTSAAVSILISVLSDPASFALHGQASRCLCSALQNMDPPVRAMHSSVVDLYVDLCKRSSQELVHDLASDLSRILLLPGILGSSQVGSLCQLIDGLWSNSDYQVGCLRLIRALCFSLRGEQRSALDAFVPRILESVSEFHLRSEALVEEAFLSMSAFGQILADYSLRLSKILYRMSESQKLGRRVVIAALKCLGSLALDISFHGGIDGVLCFVVMASGMEGELHELAESTLLRLSRYPSFDHCRCIPIIKHAASRWSIDITDILQKIIHVTPTVPVLDLGASGVLPLTPITPRTPAGSGSLDADAFIKAWASQANHSAEQWLSWLRYCQLNCLQYSPSPTLRACFEVASLDHSISQSLFHFSFLSIYSMLEGDERIRLAQQLLPALENLETPPEVLQALLNLIEFLERHDMPIPIPVTDLARYGARIHSFAKSLYYTEIEVEERVSPEALETLIDVNSHLHNLDACIGAIVHANNVPGFVLKETWFEKLNYWEEAFEAYTKLYGEAHSVASYSGILRCQYALGEWEALEKNVSDNWDSMEPAFRISVAPLASTASWGLQKWEAMERYARVIDTKTPDGALFNSIVSIRQGKSGLATDLINQTRSMLDPEITTTSGESYERAYK